MKKLFSLLLALLLIFTLASCASTPEETKTAEDSSKNNGTKANEEQLAEFIRAYRAGEYKDKMYFQYEDLEEYFTLASYEGIEYPEDDSLKETVTDGDVEDYLIRMMLNNLVSDDKYSEISDGVLQKWDVVTIDYKGFVDGVQEADASAEGEELLLGSGAYIPGFEAGLIGQKFDKEIRLDLHFSPYYSAKKMADKDVSFFVTVKKVERPEIPELTVETINQMYSTSFESLDEVKADLKEDLDAAKKSLAYSNLSSYLQNDILQRSTVKSYPQREVDHYLNHFVEYYKQYAEDGTTMEEFCQEELGMSYEAFLEKGEAYAEESVAGTLMLLQICKENDITCSDEQLEAMIQGLFENQGSIYGNMESFIADYVDIYGADYFELQVKTAAAVEKIMETAKKVEK